MKRTLPALKLKSSPLVLVLVQVRIAPVIKMADYIPDIQESLRRSGLPRFISGEEVQLQVSQGQAASVQRSPRWEFQNKEQTHGIVITQDFIAAQTTAYDVYESFEEFFTTPLEVLAEIVEPGLVQRVGLRYVDLIRPRAEQRVSEFLKPSLRGLEAADIGADDLLSRFEMLAQTAEGTMRIRCLQTNNGSPLPPDLTSLNLNLTATVPDGLLRGELVTILDLDHFSSVPRDYDPAKLIEAVGALHDNLDQAFRAAVTNEALAAWGSEERAG